MLADMIVTRRASTLLLVLCAATSQLTADDAKNLTKAEIARLGKLATALVESDRGSFGSAFCVHPSGLYVTNNHVIQNATSDVNLVINGGEPDESRLRAKVVRRDKELDLCLLRVERVKELPALTLGNVEGLHELAELVTFGYPFGRGLAAGQGKYPSVSINLASVTSLRRRDGDLNRIQLDASVNPGNSGGPVLDLTVKGRGNDCWPC
jgi:S1-C subfamily serine protease